MGSQKGVSLISLTVYIIGMTIAVTIITIISSYFYKNVDVTLKNINPLTEYTRFTSFFSNEINTDDIKVYECKQDYVVFSNGVQYSFVKGNKGIYRNKVKICKNVSECTFSYNETDNTIGIKIKIGNGDSKNDTYKLKN